MVKKSIFLCNIYVVARGDHGVWYRVRIECINTHSSHLALPQVASGANAVGLDLLSWQHRPGEKTTLLWRLDIIILNWQNRTKKYINI